MKKSPPAPVYLVAGEEDALVDRSLDLITRRVLAEEKLVDFSLTRLDGKSVSAKEVEAAARTASLFGGRRLVILRDANQLGSDEQGKLLPYLEDPLPTATLVLVVRGVGARTKDPRQARAVDAVKMLSEAVERGGGVSVDCPRPKPGELPKLAEQILKEHRLTAGRDAIYSLVEAVGEDLGTLIQAAEKLSLYLGGEGVVTDREVAEVVINTKSQSVFALVDAVAEGSMDRALRVLAGMLRDGENPLAILGHLARHFRNLAGVQALGIRGKGAQEIRKNLGLHPFVVQKCQLQLRRFSQEALTKRLSLLGEADLELKGGRLPEALVLEKLVIALCEGRYAKITHAVP